MMGSKYVQSRIGNCYREAEKFLKSGRDVLFTGVPCQITGLHKFLRKEYPNLLSVDCLCHGVPSPGIWRRYLHETVGGADYKDKITGIEFRNKYLGGWKNYSFLITGKAVSNDENKVLYSEAHDKNAYMRGFLSDIYLRPSCYSCKCKNGASHSDLTLADFWGIDVISPDVYDDKGVFIRC